MFLTLENIKKLKHRDLLTVNDLQIGIPYLMINNIEISNDKCDGLIVYLLSNGCVTHKILGLPVCDRRNYLYYPLITQEQYDYYDFCYKLSGKKVNDDESYRQVKPEYDEFIKKHDILNEENKCK